MKKIIAKLSTAIILITIAICSIACSKTASTPITEPYEYEIDVNSEEWKNMTDEQKIASCNIPDNILSRLTTAALVSTMAKYPPAGETNKEKTAWLIDARDMEVVAQSFNGINELVTREDALKELLIYSRDIFKDRDTVPGTEMAFTAALIRYVAEKTVDLDSVIATVKADADTSDMTKLDDKDIPDAIVKSVNEYCSNLECKLSPEITAVYKNDNKYIVYGANKDADVSYYRKNAGDFIVGNLLLADNDTTYNFETEVQADTDTATVTKYTVTRSAYSIVEALQKYGEELIK